MAKDLKYKNVTISGLPGAGSSTLGKQLAKVLRWEYFSGGDFMRAYAIEKGLFDAKSTVHHAATVYSDDFDRKVDFGMRETLEKKTGQILDSWLSGFMAQGVGRTLKILVYCSNDAIRIDRVMNRDGLTVDEAKKHLFERENKNVGKWARMYKDQWQDWIVKKGILTKEKDIWFWYHKMYDLTIDTFGHNPKETLSIALEELGYEK